MDPDPVENGMEWIWICLKLEWNRSDSGWNFNGLDPDPLENVKRVNTPTKMECVGQAMFLLSI